MGTPEAAIDAGTALLWIGTNLALVAFSYRTSRVLFATEEFAVQLTATLLLFVSTILLAVIGLGASGLLSGSLLLTLVAIVSIFGWWCAESGHGLKPPTAQQGRETGTSVRQRHQVRGQVWMWVWTIAGAFALAYVVSTGLLEFPSDFDSLMYHLPIIDQWLQAGSLYAPNSSYWWTPGTCEGVGLWMVAPFSGDFLAALNNLPFALLWATAGLALAYELDLPRPVAHLGALVSLLTYNTLDELNDVKNDLAIAALCIAGACFGLRFLRCSRTRDLVYFSMAVGALCGVKYNALGYAALLIATVVGLSSVSHDSATTRRAVAVSAIGILLLSAYWYGRNWIVGTSPIYPMGLGHDIATTYPDIWSTTFLGNADPRIPRMSIEALWKMTGPIHLVAVISAPLVTAYLAFHSLVPARRDRLACAFLSILLPGSACILLMTPFCLEDQPGTLNHLQWAYTPTRYGLSFLSIAVLTLFHVAGDLWNSNVSRWRRRRRRLARLLGCSSISLLLGCRRVDTLPVVMLIAVVLWQIVHCSRYVGSHFGFDATGLIAFNLLVLAAVVVWASSQIPQWAIRSSGVVVCLVLAVAIGFLSQRWHDGYARFYDEFFDTTIFQQAEDFGLIWGDQVCVLELRAYPFFGSRRQTRVLRPRVVSSSDSLFDYLRDHHVRVVATHAGDRQHYYLYANTYAWLQRDQRRYTLFTNSGHYSVYTVKHSPETEGRPIRGERSPAP